MKGLIFYYSGSGNTKLACNYLKGKLSQVIDIELFNIVHCSEIGNYRVIYFVFEKEFKVTKNHKNKNKLKKKY